MLGILIVVICGFYALNSYIYQQKQGPVVQLSDGEHLGFVHAFTDNNTAIDFDDASWFTGAAAEDAAIRAGLCDDETRDECVPNGFFIENTEAKTERIAVAPNAKVSMQTWKMEETGEVAPREISLGDFAALINDPAAHWQKLPYRITVDKNVVTGIEEVYIP